MWLDLRFLWNFLGVKVYTGVYRPLFPMEIIRHFKAVPQEIPGYSCNSMNLYSLYRGMY